MEKRYFKGFQDRKEFKGELFGISDLSDKLFTGEVIELHEKQGNEYNTITGRSLIWLDLKMDLVPKKETATKFLVDDDRETTGEPILADLGILYAHGNEDIVNFGAGNQENAKQKTGLKDTHDSAIPLWMKRSDVEGEKKKVELGASARQQKRSQYSLLAQSMGMEEVEFSRWLLSATPAAEREKVL